MSYVAIVVLSTIIAPSTLLENEVSENSIIHTQVCTTHFVDNAFNQTFLNDKSVFHANYT